MAKVRQNEVLGKALSSDTSVVPRFTIKKPDGTVVAENATIELTNPVVTEGMAVDKQAMDECLSASGTTAGSATAYTLAQQNFALFDGAIIRFKLHVDSGATPTINVNRTGAKKLMQDKYTPMNPGIPAGTWLTAVYSTTFGFFVLQGSSTTGYSTYGMGPCQLSAYEIMVHGHSDPFYQRWNERR